MDDLKKNSAAITGAIIGLIVAVCLFTIGFWKMLLVFLFMIIGALIAHYLQKTELLSQIKNIKLR